MEATMRRSPRLVLAASTAATLFATLGARAQAAPISPAQPTNRGYEHMVRLEAARDAAMAARGHPHGARSARLTPSAPRIFGTVVDVQPISEDTLHQGERDTEVEPDIFMHPNDPDDIVAVVQQGRFKTGGSADPGWATSVDAGHTWTHGDLPGLTKAVGGPFDRGSDATVAFGPDHVAYASTIDFGFRHDCPSAVGVNVSHDGGLTWDDPVFPENDASCDVFNDKNWLAVDTNPASPFFNRVYLVWSQFTSAGGAGVLRYSDDDGVTWSDLITLASPSDEVEGLLPLVHADGDVTVVTDSFVGGQDLEVAYTSTDGGLTWGPA